MFSWGTLKESISAFLAEDMPTHAAALSYYMVFSLPSMLLVVLWTAGSFLDEAALREAIFTEFGKLVGEDGAQQVMATIENLNIQETSWWATAIGFAAMLFFATTVFDAMRTSLNRLAGTDTTRSISLSAWQLVRVRLIAVALLLSFSFLLVVFLVLDALITAIDTLLAQWLGGIPGALSAIDGFALETFATTVLFAMYFRYLPDVRLQWRDTWPGALVTAILFIIGKQCISHFIGDSEAAAVYEAAGSILVLMLWVYYAAAILLFGAAFTFTRARLRNNSPVSGSPRSGQTSTP